MVTWPLYATLSDSKRSLYPQLYVILNYTYVIPAGSRKHKESKNMKNKLSAVLVGMVIALLGTSSALADGMPPWRLVPVDIWTCSFNDRKDMGDLDDWAEKFNAWADDQEDDTYAAWTLTPMYYGSGQDFDFIWLGAWKDANAFGAGWDSWNATNNGLMREFTEISSCNEHSNLVSGAFRLPEDVDMSGNGVIMVSDCKQHEGASDMAVGNAMERWVGVLDEAGAKNAIYHWWPVFGGGDADFDFKRVEVYENYTDLGAMYEMMGNGNLYQRYQALLGPVVSCDESRVYNATSRRFINVRGE
jgi:hypothetical protein